MIVQQIEDVTIVVGTCAAGTVHIPTGGTVGRYEYSKFQISLLLLAVDSFRTLFFSLHPFFFGGGKFCVKRWI